MRRLGFMGLFVVAFTIACSSSDSSPAPAGDTGTGADTTTAGDTATPTDTGSPTDGGATSACSCNDTSTSFCAEIVGTGAPLKGACDGMKSGCKKVYADTTCPTDGEIGRCVGSSSVVGSNVFYSTGDTPWTADKAQATCGSGQTWKPK